LYPLDVDAEDALLELRAEGELEREELPAEVDQDEADEMDDDRRRLDGM